jgi:hypothetical protein
VVDPTVLDCLGEQSSRVCFGFDAAPLGTLVVEATQAGVLLIEKELDSASPGERALLNRHLRELTVKLSAISGVAHLPDDH